MFWCQEKLVFTGILFGSGPTCCREESYRKLPWWGRALAFCHGAGKGTELKDGFASYFYSREPNLSFGVSELPVADLGFESPKCWGIYAEGCGVTDVV